jgi:hypothetical protein
MLILVLCKKSKISGTRDIWTKQTFYYLFTGRVSDNHRLLLQADSGSSYGFLGIATGHEQRELWICVYDIAIFLDETFESWKIFLSSSLQVESSEGMHQAGRTTLPNLSLPLLGPLLSLCLGRDFTLEMSRNCTRSVGVLAIFRVILHSTPAISSYHALLLLGKCHLHLDWQGLGFSIDKQIGFAMCVCSVQFWPIKTPSH